MDFYLCVTVKYQVYRRKPRILEELRLEITAARRSHMQRSPLKLTEVTATTAHRSVKCLVANGQHFEHLQ
ncbi:hypothetical protein C0J52_25089 [Blattella germanica]|nr:hypothetical protein C0J52_25089 [Blattella germanica]